MRFRQLLQQVLHMVKEGKIIAQDGTSVRIKADRLCLHGDQPDAVEAVQ